MALFYGQLKGNRGTATRLGNSDSGIGASVQSWNGSVTVELSDDNGTAFCKIRVAGGSAFGGHILWQGPVTDLLDAKLRLDRGV
jgi:hypothetical protein